MDAAAREAVSEFEAFVAEHPEEVALYEEGDLVDQYIRLRFEAMQAMRKLRASGEQV